MISFQTGFYVEGFLIRNKTLIYLGGHLTKGRGKVCIVLYYWYMYMMLAHYFQLKNQYFFL
jgi:hypothetical protein